MEELTNTLFGKPLTYNTACALAHTACLSHLLRLTKEIFFSKVKVSCASAKGKLNKCNKTIVIHGNNKGNT